MDETPTSSPGSTPDEAMILRFRNDALVDPKENTFDVPGKIADLFAKKGISETPDEGAVILPFPTKPLAAKESRKNDMEQFLKKATRIPIED